MIKFYKIVEQDNLCLFFAKYFKMFENILKSTSFSDERILKIQIEFELFVHWKCFIIFPF